MGRTVHHDHFICSDFRTYRSCDFTCRKALTKIADFAALGLVNKILGGVFGLLKFGLILSVILLVFSKLNKTIPFVAEEEQNNSVLYEPVKNLAPMLFPGFVKVAEEEADDFSFEI